MILKKLEMLVYISKRDTRIKFEKAEDKFTSRHALIKAKQLLWKIKLKHLPILQNASYCYSFVWTSGDLYECRRYYVIDIYDDVTYARILENPAEIYSPPEFKDKVQYTKLYNNINRVIRNFLNEKKYGEQFGQGLRNV